VGRDVQLAELENGYDAIFVAVGLGATARLRIPGEELHGVWDALSWIELIKIGPYEKVPVGRRVAVVGAGNTAIDAVTQAKRLGAERSFLVYRRGPEEMPAYHYEYDLAKGDGCGFEWFTLPVRIEGNGRVERLVCRRTRPTAPDAEGRRGVEEIPGSEFTLECDMVIKATGQTTRGEFLKTLPIELDAKGRVKVDMAMMQTSNPKYFAGGDCVNGGAEAVNAVQDGKLAARGIEKWLSR
jgi:glutamate synthase (NADPH/NADH) small chain